MRASFLVGKPGTPQSGVRLPMRGTALRPHHPPESSGEEGVKPPDGPIRICNCGADATATVGLAMTCISSIFREERLSPSDALYQRG